MRSWVMTTLLVTVGLMIWSIPAPAPATAQSQDGPGELWDAYPLDEREAEPIATPTADAPTPVRAPAAAGADETAAGWSLGVLLAGALAAFAVGVLLPLLRRDRPAPSRQRSDRRRCVTSGRAASPPAALAIGSTSGTSSDSRRE